MKRVVLRVAQVDTFQAQGRTGVCGFSSRLVRKRDLPSDKMMTAYIKEAARLNDDGVKVPSKPKSKEKKELKIPAALTAALKRNKEAKQTFDNFSYSNKKEYVEWITEAKSNATQKKRLTTAIEWMAEGKIRNWKYVRK